MDWTTFRSEFPITRRWAFFDHAAVAPISGRAQQALAAWATDMAENGDVHEPQWVQRVEAVRRLAGQLIHVDPLDIAFVKNTSEGIGILAEGFPWKPGDNIITAAEEYPSNIYPWMNLAGRGVEVRLLTGRDRRLWVDDLRALMDQRTRLVSLSFVEFASGFRRDLVDLLHAVGVGWNSVIGCRDFSRIDFRLKPHAGRWESGTLNVGGIMALGASLELLLGIGIPAVTGRLLELTDHLCE